jgi:hypothetical protein
MASNVSRASTPGATALPPTGGSFSVTVVLVVVEPEASKTEVGFFFFYRRANPKQCKVIRTREVMQG